MYYFKTIRRTIDHRTSELVSRFGDCLNQIKKEMTQRVNTGLPIPTEAYYSGQALYWKFLRRRLEKDMLVGHMNICTIIFSYGILKNKMNNYFFVERIISV